MEPSTPPTQGGGDRHIPTQAVGLVFVGIVLASVGISLLLAHDESSGGGRGVFFKGDFETGDASQWQQVWQVPEGARFSVGRSNPAPAQGRYRARFEVRPGDEERWTGDPRTEVSQGKPQYRLREGMDLYIAFQVYFPQNFPLHQEGWGQLVWQLHQASSRGSPPQGLYILDSGNWELQGDRYKTHDAFVYWRGPPVALGRWQDFIVHIKFSTDPATGFAELWKDGVPQTMANGKRRIHARTLVDESSEMKLGLYRAPEYRWSSVMFADGYIVGHSLEDVLR